jgi:hypothetical protein
MKFPLKTPLTLHPLSRCSLRSVGVVPSTSSEEGRQANDREFKLAVRWIVLGDLLKQDGQSWSSAKDRPDDWPGMSFYGGSTQIVLRKLLEDYAPKRWPKHSFERSKYTVEEEFFTGSGSSAEHSQDDAVSKSLIAIEKALYRDHQEPCFILDSKCFFPLLEPSSHPCYSIETAPPFQTDHANCICGTSVPFCGPTVERLIFIKDSNANCPKGALVNIPGLLTRDGHKRTPPFIIWIRPALDDIQVIAPAAVSPPEIHTMNCESLSVYITDAL